MIAFFVYERAFDLRSAGRRLISFHPSFNTFFIILVLFKRASAYFVLSHFGLSGLLLFHIVLSFHLVFITALSEHTSLIREGTDCDCKIDLDMCARNLKCS